MTKAFEVTTQDILFILKMHDVTLPVDVLEALHDDICNEFDEIIHKGLKYSTELVEQNDYIMSKIEDIMICKNLYIKEPKILEAYND
jgi:hypothetical protein